MEASEDASNLKEAMAVNEVNGDEGESSKEGQQGHEASDKGQSDHGDVCRDYMRNVCTRGKKCKYSHPESKGDTNNAAALLQVRKYYFLSRKIVKLCLHFKI